MLQNTVSIRECYTPSFLTYLKKYIVHPFLVSDQVAKEINGIEDKFLRHNRLEKYLFGNLHTFFQHIGFEFNKETHFLKVSVVDAAFYDRALPVYHNQKKTAFRITFKVNFKLPQTVRLGQSTAVGFGDVFHI